MAETYTFPIVPPSGPTNVTASYDDILLAPQDFFAGADMVWVMTSSALVLLMVPAMCLFYSGESIRSKSLLMFRIPLLTTSLVGFQWYMWGYTLAFTPAVPPSTSSSPISPTWYGSSPSGIGLRNALARPTGAPGPKIPELLYQFYEGMFASFTASLVSGAVHANVRAGRFLVFITLWSVLVYAPVARWTWHWNGWGVTHGVMDFAGGTAVHVASGCSVLGSNVFCEVEMWGFGACWGRLRERFGFGRERGEGRVKSRGTNRESVAPTPFGDVDDAGGRGSGSGRFTEDLSVSDSKRQTTQRHHTSSPTPHPPRSTMWSSIPLSSPSPSPAYFHSHSHSHSRTDIDTDTDPVQVTDSSPHSTPNMVLGTALLWIGWFGFTGGSALGANLRAVIACTNTHVAACAGSSTMLGLFWLFNSLSRHSPPAFPSQSPRIASVTNFCDGAVVALVAITPAAGYVPPWSAGVIGVVSAGVVYFLKMAAGILPGERPLFVATIHAGGGFVGMVLTGAFADGAIVGLDGWSTLVPGRSRAEMVAWQLVDAVAGSAYCFGMTVGILCLMKLVYVLWKRFGLGGDEEEEEEEEEKKKRWKLEANDVATWRRLDATVAV